MRALKKSDLKLTMREQAKRTVRPDAINVGANRGFRDKVEQGRQQFLQASNEGGDAMAKKYRGELTYLLNNYLPSYDMRIEQLIDSWRRTGDPSYDPAIRVKLREARRNYNSKSSAV